MSEIKKAVELLSCIVEDKMQGDFSLNIESLIEIIKNNICSCSLPFYNADKKIRNEITSIFKSRNIFFNEKTGIPYKNQAI